MPVDDMQSEGSIRQRWLPRENARRQIDRFMDRFGIKAMHLACHAALPLVLSPELVHLIRLNFLDGWNIPAISEADLLLSPLCRPLDEPLYEMEPRIREILLEHLPVDFGEQRPLDLAWLLMAWLKEKPLRERNQQETDAHSWIMAAWLYPEETVLNLEETFNATEEGGARRSDRLRLVHLAEVLAEPLSMEPVDNRYRELLIRTRKAAGEFLVSAAAALTAHAAAEQTGPSHGDILEIHLSKSKTPMRFIYIEPGEFLMGSPSDEPGRWDDEKLHKVILTEGFYMQETPVTQGQWEAVMGSNPANFKDGGPDCPVEQVSWEDVQEFLGRLNSESAEWEYRLPTEAQWEYACRAGTTTPFWTGRCLSTEEANYDGNYPLEGCPKGVYREKTTPVKSFAPNAWGLYDMHGNVREWCADWFGDYPDGPVTEPTGPDKGADRVYRGGSWIDCARGCRSACRVRVTPDDRYGNLGFRVFAVRRAAGSKSSP